MGKIDLGAAFSKGWELFQKNMAPLIVGTLLTMIIGVFSLGFLMPVMWGGLVIIVKKSWNGETAEIGDVFKGFSNFASLFLGGLIMLGMVIVGVLACGVGAIITSAIVIFMFPLIVDGNSAGEAFGKSWAAFKENALGFIVLSLVTGLLMSAGNMALYIGGLFTMPFGICITYAAYKQVFGDTI